MAPGATYGSLHPLPLSRSFISGYITPLHITKSVPVVSLSGQSQIVWMEVLLMYSMVKATSWPSIACTTWRRWLHTVCTWKEKFMNKHLLFVTCVHFAGTFMPETFIFHWRISMEIWWADCFVVNNLPCKQVLQMIVVQCDLSLTSNWTSWHSTF